LARSGNLPPPLAKLKEALENVKDETKKDAAVVAALVLYKTLVKNAEAYRSGLGVQLGEESGREAGVHRVGRRHKRGSARRRGGWRRRLRR
jgi:hypothetical protein